MPGVAEPATPVGFERSSGRVVMNVLHRWVCASSRWRQTMEDHTLPWVLDGIDLGPNILEIGPGPGISTDILRARVTSLTCVEIDRRFADSLKRGLRARTKRWCAKMPRRCRLRTMYSMQLLVLQCCTMFPRRHCKIICCAKFYGYFGRVESLREWIACIAGHSVFGTYSTP